MDTAACPAQNMDANQNAHIEFDATTNNLPEQSDIEENSNTSDYDPALVSLSTLFTSVREPLPEKLHSKDITERAQRLIDNLNSKRKHDTQLLTEYKQALEEQVQKSVSALEQHMFQMCESQRHVIEAKLQELFASLDRAAGSEAELDNFKQSFKMLYTEMQNTQ